MATASNVATYLLCRDLEIGQQFYAALAGYRLAERGPWFVLLALDGEERQRLCLVDWVSQFLPRAARGDPQGAFLEVVVEDVAAAVGAVRSFSIEITEEPIAGDAGSRATARDPNGHVVAVTTPAARFTQPPRKTIA